jgi:hypothetical protein
MTKKISYKKINGGRSTSFEDQYKTSFASIVILLIGVILLVVIQLVPDLTHSLFGVITMGVLTIYWILGFIMQLLGTSFEKRWMTGVLALGIFAHLMLFLDYFSA